MEKNMINVAYNDDDDDNEDDDFLGGVMMMILYFKEFVVYNISLAHSH